MFDAFLNLKLRSIPDLVNTLKIQASVNLAHMRSETHNEDVEIILEMIEDQHEPKAEGNTIEDRNTLPAEDMFRANGNVMSVIIELSKKVGNNTNAAALHNVISEYMLHKQHSSQNWLIDLSRPVSIFHSIPTFLKRGDFRYHLGMAL